MEQIRRDESSDHLPPNWHDQPAYEAFCRRVNPIGSYTEDDYLWKEIRIHRGATAEEVYRRLPSAAEHEFGGYLTKTRIRYYASTARSAWIPQSRSCTFHSHPTQLPDSHPDIPSATDIRLFLLGRNWRTITVGLSQIWVMDKTEGSLAMIRRLAAWEQAHMSHEIDRLREERPIDWESTYSEIAIQKLGVSVPFHTSKQATWPTSLGEVLRLRITLFDRVQVADQA